MTNKEIYDQIVDLTRKVATTCVGTKIVETAKTGEINKVIEVFETFKSQNSELYQAILKFKEEYEKAGTPEIFAKEDTNEEESLYKYDSKEIDIFNLYILLFIAEINDANLFKDLEIAIDQLEEQKHSKMAKHFEYYGPEYPCYAMLVTIFSKNPDIATE